MSPQVQQYASLAGRVLLSVIFLLSGITKLMQWEGTQAHMIAQGMPAGAVPVLLALATLVEIVGGLALLLGFQTRYFSLLLFLYLIPTTLIFHNFWAYQGQAQQAQLINFLKNLAIMGGLLKFFAEGAGAISLDAALSASRYAPAMLWPRRGRRV